VVRGRGKENENKSNAQPQETNVTLRYLLSPLLLADVPFPVPVGWFCASCPD